MTTPRRRRVGQQVISFDQVDERRAFVVQVIEWSDDTFTVERVPMVWLAPGFWCRDMGAAPC